MHKEKNMVTDFLKTIVAHKKKEIKALKETIPESRLYRICQTKRKIRPFYDALKDTHGIHIIAEIKRASPSKGDICVDLDPAKMAAAYETGGARAISVLTDETFFKGSRDDFIRARNATSLPLLRKDFILSACQVYESYIMGADALLLIAKILSRDKLNDLLALTHSLKMTALVEINSEADFKKAENAGARLIGINNRNLTSFDTDITTATRLVSLFNKDQVAVAASGISNKKILSKPAGPVSEISLSAKALSKPGTLHLF